MDEQKPRKTETQEAQADKANRKQTIYEIMAEYDEGLARMRRAEQAMLAER